MLPKIDLRRTYLIARRDFLGYIKTWGFWISFLMPFLFGGLGFFASQMNLSLDPVRYETILDETGKYGEGILAFEQAKWDKAKAKMQESLPPALAQEGMDSVQSKVIFLDPPSQDIDVIKAYVQGEKNLNIDGENIQLNGALHISDGESGPIVNYWTRNINSNYARNLASNYFRKRATDSYLASGDLTQAGLSKAQAGAATIEIYDPSKIDDGGPGGQVVTKEDKIPFYVATAAAAILWLTIFSGAYMLLTSMLEEKLNKLLEMMLSTTRLSEIMLGKLLGVAALTITAMLPYILIGVGGSVFIAIAASPEVAEGLKNAISLKLIIFFPVFLVLGYLFYGALFIAMGSLAESMQDAQTLTTPIMLVLTACIMVVPLGLNSPDSPVLTFAAWFPLSAPFAAIVRLPLDPPWWELALSATFLFILSMFVIWIAGRIFQYGVMSGAGLKGVTDWIKRVIFRRKISG